MRYPSINKQPKRSVSIPSLKGGINLRDSLTLINDDQLTDCKNVWFKDGLLKTRPGLKSVGVIEYDNFAPSLGGMELTDIQGENVYRTVDCKKYQLISRHTEFYHRAESEMPWLGSNSHLQFFWAGESGIIELPSLTSTQGIVFKNYFVVQTGNLLYCFAETDEGGEIFKLEDGAQQWKKLSDDDIYIPTVFIHGVTNGDMTFPEETAGLGTMLEGYNLLGNYYKMIYSTVNKNSEGHYMIYGLLHNVYSEEYAGKKIKAVITDKNGVKHSHEIVLTAEKGWKEESGYGTDGLKMKTYGPFIGFAKEGDESSFYSITKDEFVEDNLLITAPVANSKKNLKKIFSMKKQIWFGGDAKGISGGSRLFLTANSNTDEKNLMVWSGLNNPLYFSENCYAYVGDASQAVTGFGRQSDMLVIFKENETYFTQYVKNSNITADDLIKQKVVDYEANSVYFPIVTLNAKIGCDCPDTIQLCKNRLVWAASNGKVYTLCNNNQFSERNIYEISGMIERKLKSEDNLKLAFSIDIDNCYMLFTEKNVYVMQYESYGYTYIASYSKTEDAQLRIPWWCWELPYSVAAAIDIENKAYIINRKNFAHDCDYYVWQLDDKVYTDCKDNYIHSKIVTKFFDFGAPSLFKTVPLVSISLGGNGGNPVTVTFITDNGNNGTEEIFVYDGNSDCYSPSFVRSRQLRPCCSIINRISLEIECKGAMSIAAISLSYRILGGER